MRRLNQTRFPLKHKNNLYGQGFADIIQGVYKTGKLIYDNREKIDKYGTMFSNLLPNADETGRPGFPGERHAILKLPNGRLGIGNYIGPGTHLLERLKRGDPPRTEVDKTAIAHDIRYALADNLKDIREADNIMIDKIDEIQRNKKDHPLNVLQGKLIKLKRKAEDLGVLKRDSFAGSLSKDPSPCDRQLLEETLKPLAMKGYGLPGEDLKKKLIKAYSIEKMAVNIVKALLKDVDVNVKNVEGIVKNAKLKGKFNIKKLSNNLFDEMTKNVKINNDKRDKLTKMLNKSLYKALSNSMKMVGSGRRKIKKKEMREFWRSFKKGFNMVVKPGTKILGAVATAVGKPEVGIPISILSELL